MDGLTVYEAHKDPKGIFSRYLMKKFVTTKKLRLVTISGALGTDY